MPRADGATLNCVIRTGLKVKKKSTLYGFGGAGFVTEGTVSAKALRQEWVFGVWLEGREGSMKGDEVGEASPLWAGV